LAVNLEADVYSQRPRRVRGQLGGEAGNGGTADMLASAFNPN